jgi:hypothetical protein
MVRLLLALLCTTSLACASTATVGTYVPRPPEEGTDEARAAQGSLFPADAEILTDAAIAGLLQAQPRLPERARFGLVQLSHRSGIPTLYGYGYGYAQLRAPQLQHELNLQFVETLRAASAVRDASYLPAFLVPEKPTVGHLREAAARYQADALLLFSSECQLYDRFRFFAETQVRAYCIADSALLDVRTGLVPFTSRARQEVTFVKDRTELQLAETMRRTELEALGRALQENAENLVRFLGGAGAATPPPAR